MSALSAFAAINTTPQAPPGTSQIATVVQWIAWGAAIACFMGFIVGAGMLGFAAYQGRESHAGKGMVFALVGAVLLGAAGVIVGQFAHV